MGRFVRNGNQWNSLDLASIGMTLVFAIGIGSGLGWWVGGKWGNQSIGLIVGFVLGTASGFMEMFRAVARWNRRVERHERANRTDGGNV